MYSIHVSDQISSSYYAGFFFGGVGAGNGISAKAKPFRSIPGVHLTLEQLLQKIPLLYPPAHVWMINEMHHK